MIRKLFQLLLLIVVVLFFITSLILKERAVVIPPRKKNSVPDLNNAESPLEFLTVVSRKADTIALSSEKETFSKVTNHGVMSRFNRTYMNIMEHCVLLKSMDFNKTITSAQYSRIEKIVKDANQKVLYVDIQTYNKQNQKKTIGGDLLHVTGRQIDGDGKIAGYVMDLGKGKYIGLLNVPWSGQTEVTAHLEFALENSCSSLQAIEDFGNMHYALEQGYGIRAYFQRDLGVEEYTACSPDSFISGYTDLCNMTELNGNMSWFCVRPTDPRLQCTDVRSFRMGPLSIATDKTPKKVIKPTMEKFTHKHVVKLEGFGQVKKDSSSIHLPFCSQRQLLDTWQEALTRPSGYWWGGRWHFANCHPNIPHDMDKYRQCLRGKTIYFFGDSTVRQYMQYLCEHLLDINRNKISVYFLGENGTTYHLRDVISKYGISMAFRKHAMPMHNPKFPSHGITSYSTELQTLSQSDILDDSLIVCIGLHLHFKVFPIKVFRDRIAKLAVAITEFLKKKPKTKFLFKGPHYINADINCFHSDMALLYRDIVYDEFSKLNLLSKVIYLDTWWITVTFDNNLTHPKKYVFESQIQQFMAYLC